jgi:RNA polymerase sigma-70 factor, ECF subfamily
VPGILSSLVSIFVWPLHSVKAVADVRPEHHVQVDPVSDADLVGRAQRGERGAEEALYRRHVGIVSNVATRLLRGSSDVDDVIQETFIIALERLGTLRDPAAFRGWVVQIAVRQVHRRFRRRKLMRALGMTSIASADDVGLVGLARRDVDGEMRAELAILDRVLDKIDAAQRIAWMLRHVEGLALDEVADACQCSLATAKRRIQAADQHIRKHVKLEGTFDG